MTKEESKPINAINFAISDECDDSKLFLDCWSYGDVREWPEYTKYLEKIKPAGEIK